MNAKFPFDNTYSTLPRQFFHKQKPAAVSKAELIACNFQLAEELDIKLPSSGLELIFSGQMIPDGADPLAQAYAGHQFGYYNAQLGDGRALLLGELNTKLGRYDIQLKGSGTTPYSRSGDGLSWLGPVLREYIVSEAMHHLGIPTTRSLAAVETGDKVLRETVLPGAILTRIAKSHIRVGTFQYFAHNKDTEALETLYKYTQERHYNETKSISEFLSCVINAQSDLITDWLSVGFIHGVMNTDNMALSGETIDYGPCAFMDTFAPDTVFSSIDHKGRYAYANQPYIAQWNIARLAESLLPLIEGNKEETIAMAEDVLNSFEQVYKKRWLSMMRSKLGLASAEKEDEKLITDLLDWMHVSQSDYTNTFRNLSNSTLISGELYASKNFQNWHSRWQDRLEKEEQDRESSIAQMRSVNPSVIPRNHKVEEALQAGEQSDFKPFHDLINAMNEPYEEGEHLLPYQAPPQPGEKVLQTFCGT